MVRTKRSVAVLLLACLAVLGIVSPAVLGIASPAGAAERHLVKVFVVTDASQTLPAIAAATLGDAGRAQEILTLNQGRRQPDGGALTSATDQLHVGWILRLPNDASGPQVQTAQDNSQATTPPAPAASAPAATTSGTVVTFPLAAALAVVGSILLALLTAAIVARRRTARWFAFLGRAVAALGAPARRRRRLEVRRSLSTRFAADADAVRRAYNTLGDLAATQRDEPVYALSVGEAGPTVWLTAADKLDSSWQSIDNTRWRRPAGAGRNAGQPTAGQPTAGQPTAGQVRAAQAEQAIACLVRVGADDDGEPVFVDLSRLDGVLSVTGDRDVARDVVHNLLAEIARVRPNTPVTVLTAAGGSPIDLPAGLNPIARVPVPAATGSGARGTVRGAAARRPVGGLVVLAGTPGERETAELLALCGTAGAGWTGLVCGPVDGGAHWRWHTGPDGTVEIPVLGVELTVPA
jgi:hypothetical protein